MSLVEHGVLDEPTGRLPGPRRHVEPDAVHVARHLPRVRLDLRRLPHAVHRGPGRALLRSRLHAEFRRVARRRRGRREGAGDINADASVFVPAPAADAPGCAPETTPPDPDDPTLQVGFEVRCAEPGTDPPYLVDVTVTNGPVSPWRGTYSTGAATEDAYLTNGESDTETLSYGPSATLTVGGYFDVNTNGMQDAGDVDYVYSTPLAVPEDCAAGTTTDSSDRPTPPTRRPTSSTTSTSRRRSRRARRSRSWWSSRRHRRSLRRNRRRNRRRSPRRCRRPTRRPRQQRPARRRWLARSGRPRRPPHRLPAGPGPGLPIRTTTTTILIIVPPRLTVPGPPGFGATGVDARRAAGAPLPAVGAASTRPGRCCRQRLLVGAASSSWHPC